ncbi:MAG: DUF2399 domain-containing protein [Eubacterium sp.]|nr:DUF2399 domain-containing protein [Eubacterium sp.]
MKRYDDLILNELLNRYERSLLYTGSNQRTVNISLTINRKLIPEYFDETWSRYDIVHDQLSSLEEKGYISLVWKNGKKGHILEKVMINPDKLEECYLLLGRKSRRQKEEAVLSIAEHVRTILPSFLAWLEDRIQSGKSIRQFVDLDDPEKFSRICQLIAGIMENDNPVFLRAFSIRIFHDSKIAEKEIGSAARIIGAFHPEVRFTDLETEEILEEYEIYRNPIWLMIKGKGRFAVIKNKKSEGHYSIDDNDSYNRRYGLDGDIFEKSRAGASNHTMDGDWQQISVSSFPGGIGITQEDIPGIIWDQTFVPEHIITIENLTSFHQWQAGQDLVIYLGGYANRAKRSFLMDLKEAYPCAEFCHFGDIDCGGFRIWKNLCTETGIEIRPIYMDQETYLKYLDAGKPLTDQDIKTLKRMSQDPFFGGQKDLFGLMLDKKIKIEQESIG